jgi:hypothetical protein
MQRMARVRIVVVPLAALALAACGGGPKSTLTPAPGKGGAIALHYLTHQPEVYADATVRTVGTVVAARVGHRSLYALAGGDGGVRIVLEPTARFRGLVGRRVRVTGVFTVSFAVGYELLASAVTAI